MSKPNFQRRHYEAIAAIFRGRSAGASRAIILGDIAAMFVADNPNFDRQRFLQACGINL